MLAPRPTRRVFLLAALAWAASGPAHGQAVQVRAPWIAQKTPSDCGRAVLASLGARRRGDVEAVYRRIPDPADPAAGYSIREMVRLSARLGVGLSVRAPRGVAVTGACGENAATRAHLAELARLVRSGRPVVVPVGGGLAPGHYLILVGADAGGFSVHDPAQPGLTTLDAAALDARMCAYGRLALVGR